MDELYTPKQVARAIQVSESSVKRWCDQGEIRTQYTAGGHRRIALAGLFDFLREKERELTRPEVLGLPAVSVPGERSLARASAQLTEALLAGDEERCRRIAIDLYLAGHRLSVICDQALAPAFRAIGELWLCGQAEVYQERRACELARRVLFELRGMIQQPRIGAAVAIGGSPAGDPYELASVMAELVLRGAGWTASSLGNDLPLATLAAAMRTHQPDLFWLSCSQIRDEREFLEGFAALYDEYGGKTALIVGGRALSESIRQRMKYAAFCDTMEHLESFAQTLRQAAQSRRRQPARSK